MRCDLSPFIGVKSEGRKEDMQFKTQKKLIPILYKKEIMEKNT